MKKIEAQVRILAEINRSREGMIDLLQTEIKAYNDGLPIEEQIHLDAWGDLVDYLGVILRPGYLGAPNPDLARAEDGINRYRNSLVPVPFSPPVPEEFFSSLPKDPLSSPPENEVGLISGHTLPPTPPCDNCTQ